MPKLSKNTLLAIALSSMFPAPTQCQPTSFFDAMAQYFQSLFHTPKTQAASAKTKTIALTIDFANEDELFAQIATRLKHKLSAKDIAALREKQATIKISGKCPSSTMWRENGKIRPLYSSYEYSHYDPKNNHVAYEGSIAASHAINAAVKELIALDNKTALTKKRMLRLTIDAANEDELADKIEAELKSKLSGEDIAALRTKQAIIYLTGTCPSGTVQFHNGKARRLFEAYEYFYDLAKENKRMWGHGGMASPGQGSFMLIEGAVDFAINELIAAK